MSLLTPSESHAFQSFLSSMDYPESLTTQDWSMFSAQDMIPDSLDLPAAPGKEALAKATKDLMALDTDRWNVPSASAMHTDMQIHQQHQFNFQQHQHQLQQHQQHQQQQQQQYEYRRDQHNNRPFQNTQQNLFPYLKPPQQQQQHQRLSQLHHSHQHPPSLSISPLHTVGLPNLLPSSTSTSSSATPPYNNTPTLHTIPTLPSPYQHHSPSSTSSHSQRTSPGASKRAHDPSSSTSNKRPRPSPPTQPLAYPHSHHHNPRSTVPLGSNKPTLLSPSQKKANHIQSEQKRRANIRRGYEALCETVPALREAIREEESEMQGCNAVDDGSRSGRGKGKRGRGRGRIEDGEKVDGRAGPRSENVVLSKTIEYVNDLLSERTTLVARLERARSLLPPGAAAGTAGGTGGVLLWEREWKGGEGRTGDGDEDEDEEDVSS